MHGNEFSVEVQASLPNELSELKSLANDLSYSWNRQIRNLFFRLDPELWEHCEHKPKVFLRRISQQCLTDAAADPGFYGGLPPGADLA